MTAETATFVLPASLTFETCSDLHAFLIKAQGADLILDGSNVRRLGGLGAQLLAATSIAWAAAGRSLTISNPSGELCRGLATLALWPLPPEKGVV